VIAGITPITIPDIIITLRNQFHGSSFLHSVKADPDIMSDDTGQFYHSYDGNITIMKILRDSIFSE
jgi:hypothetical protein